MARTKSALDAFLASPAGAGHPCIDETRGFIVAVAGTPKLIQPSEWLPELFRGDMPDFTSEAQANGVVQELIECYNNALTGGRKVKALAPTFRRDILANLEDDAPASRWCRGFERAFRWLADAWPRSESPTRETARQNLITILTFFASRQTAMAALGEPEEGMTLRELGPQMRRYLPRAMEHYVEMGQLMYETQQLDEPPSVTRIKIGRNEPCPCGSGKKYKRCCALN